MQRGKGAKCVCPGLAPSLSPSLFLGLFCSLSQVPRSLEGTLICWRQSMPSSVHTLENTKTCTCTDTHARAISCMHVQTHTPVSQSACPERVSAAEHCWLSDRLHRTSVVCLYTHIGSQSCMNTSFLLYDSWIILRAAI